MGSQIDMGKIFLARHAQSLFNAGETEEFNSQLSKKGHEQAHRLAMSVKELVKPPEDYIGIVSPYNRCLQTAHKVWNLTGIKFRVRRAVGESPEEVHRGRSTSILKKEEEFSCFDWSGFNGPSLNYDLESEEEYMARVQMFCESLADNKNYIIVSHMRPITHMTRILAFGGRKEPMTITNASLTLIEDGKPVYIGMTT